MVTATLLEDRVLALAALTQAAGLASQLALTGECSDEAYQTVVEAVYALDTPSTAQLYPRQGLREGLAAFIDLLGQKQRLSSTQQSLARYMVKLHHLAKKLHKNPSLQTDIAKRIQQATLQRRFFQDEADRHLVSLADVYLGLAQSLKVHFKIIGRSQYLHDHHHVNRIRALLLAGIRAATLWQQLGGSLWHLWWRRQAYLHSASQLLQRHTTTATEQESQA